MWVVLGAAVCALALAPLADAADQPGEGSGPCALGEALSDAGEVAAAKKAFVAVLRADPASACASAGLKKLNPEAPGKPDQCDVGDAYREVDRNDDAIAAYGKELEKDPESECAKTGLEKAGPSLPTRAADEITGAIPTVLVFFGCVLVLWYILLFLCRIKRLKQFLVRLWKPGRYVQYTLRPRLSFSSFGDEAVEGSPGASLTARVKERLGRMREEALDKEAPEYDLDFGTPREEFADQVSENKSLKTALDSAAEVSDQTKLVAAAANFLSAWLPIRRFAVAGSLEPPAKSGAAINLTLEEEGRSESATRLQGPAGEEKPEAPDYMVLAAPAAVWIQYGIACALKGEKLDTAKAESQALLREGLDRYNREELGEAREAFEKAIVLDHANWGAYASLAVAEARIGQDYAQSIANILKGIERMKAADA